MTFQTVVVTWDETDIASILLGGQITFQLSAPLSDPSGQTAEPSPARTYSFTGGTGQSDPLVANDSAGAQPAGTCYTVTVSVGGERSYSFTTQINHANGSTQTLAYLRENSAQPVTRYAQYMPLPGGEPVAGDAPVVQQNGSSATAWAPVLAADGDGSELTGITPAQVGADPSGAAAAAQANAQTYAAAQAAAAQSAAEAASVPLSDLPLSLPNGGTGATSAAGARTALGLGTAAVHASTDFDAAGAASAAQAAAEAASDPAGAASAALATAETYAAAQAAAAQANAIAASLPALTQASVSASGTLALDTVTEVTAATALTMTLPASASGALIVVERASASTANVAVTGNIRGVAAQTVTLQLAGESEVFFGYGGTWWPIAGHKTLGSLQALFLQAANNLSDLASPSAARASLGLGSAALQPSSAFDAAGAAAAAQTAAETYAAAQASAAQSAAEAASLPLPSGTAAAGTVPGATGTGEASAWTTLAALGAMSSLAQSAVLTAASVAAVANQVTRVSTAGNAVTVTLPNAPANQPLVAVKLVTLGTGNAVTVQCAGSDVFNQAAGGTSLTLSLQSQGVLLTYASGVWAILSDDLPLSQLDARYLQQSQSFSLANNAYQSLYEWTVGGQTDSPLPSFGLVAGSQTYSWRSGGETTQGPAFWFGVNPGHLSNRNPTSAHAALGISAFQDAGDTWNPATGGHGLEFNIAWVSPSAAKGVAPLEIVGADDETRTVTLALRCGDGQFTAHDSTQYVSGITMSDAGGNGYLAAGPFGNSAYGSVAAGTQPGIQLQQPVSLTNLPYLYGTSPGAMTALFTAAGAQGSGAVTWSVISNNDTLTALWEGGNGVTSTVYALAGNANAAVTAQAGAATQKVWAQGTGSAAQFQAVSASGTAQFILNGNSSVSAQMVWQKNGTNTWVMQDSAGSSLYLTNNSGNAHFLLLSGTNTAGNYNAATTYILTKTLVYGSLIVNNGGSALATTATAGFLYIPTCAGTPTGTPGANAGTVPIVYDTSGDKLWIYRGGAWAGVAI